MTTQMSWRRVGLFLGTAVATLLSLRVPRLGDARIGPLETVSLRSVPREARAAKAFLWTTGSPG